MKWTGKLCAGAALVSMLAMAGAAHAAGNDLRPDQVTFRALYKELVETDTSITTGSCTALADKIDVHLREAGFTAADITRFAVAEHPKEGGLEGGLAHLNPAACNQLLDE